VPDSICAEITLGRAWPSIGDAPGYYTLLVPGLDIRGFPELSTIRIASKLLGCALGKEASSAIYALTVMKTKPFPRPTMQRVRVRVAELQLDMFVVGLNRPGADPQFFRDATCSEAGTN
jgi:hypothetical protein